MKNKKTIWMQTLFYTLPSLSKSVFTFTTCGSPTKLLDLAYANGGCGTNWNGKVLLTALKKWPSLPPSLRRDLGDSKMSRRASARKF